MVIRYELGKLDYKNLMNKSNGLSGKDKTQYKNIAKNFIKNHLEREGFKYVKFKAYRKEKFFDILVSIKKVKEVKREVHKRSINPEIDKINFNITINKFDNILHLTQSNSGIFNDILDNRWDFKDIKQFV